MKIKLEIEKSSKTVNLLIPSGSRFVQDFDIRWFLYRLVIYSVSYNTKRPNLEMDEHLFNYLRTHIHLLSSSIIHIKLT